MERSRRFIPLIAVLSLVSAGCATVSRDVATAPVRATAWHTAAEGVTAAGIQDLSRWWERLGDPVLTDLVTRALRESPDVRLAQARLRQARAQYGVAHADLVPSVAASGSASGRRTSGDGVGGTGAAASSGNGTFAASIDASWEPDVFGGTRKGVEAAAADVHATAADLYATHVSLAAEVVRTYVDLRTTQARLEIAHKNEKSQAETLELTSFRAQAGLVGSLDVEQARASLEQTRAQIPSLESSVAQATFRLATLAGAEPGSLTAQLGAAAPIPAIPPDVQVGIPAETLRQRPDVRAAEQRIIAETARLAQAGTRRYPRFNLSGSLGPQYVTGALSGGTSLVASVAASVLQTLFDGGRIRQQIAVQDAVQEQAVVNYEATVLTALEDVENALVAFDKSRLRLASLASAEEAASNAAILARTQYTAGLADFETVLLTERTVLTVQDSLAATQGDRLTALVQLYKALGGGWSPSDLAHSARTTS